MHIIEKISQKNNEFISKTEANSYYYPEMRFLGHM